MAKKTKYVTPNSTLASSESEWFNALLSIKSHECLPIIKVSQPQTTGIMGLTMSILPYILKNIKTLRRLLKGPVCMLFMWEAQILFPPPQGPLTTAKSKP